MNKPSYASTLVNDLHNGNENPKNVEFCAYGESFNLQPEHIVNYFVEYNISKDFLVI